MRSRVSSDAQQFARPFSTLLTVGTLTPARAATSANVVRAAEGDGLSRPSGRGTLEKLLSMCFGAVAPYSFRPLIHAHPTRNGPIRPVLPASARLMRQ
jgi:hypothetical protein